MDSEDNFDYEVFLSTVTSHLRVVTKFVLSFSLNWTTLACFGHSVQLFLMRPQTFALLSAVIVVALICHTFEFWFRYFIKRGLRLAKKFNIKCGFATSAFSAILPSSELLNGFVSAHQEVHQLIENNVGVYAMQGRRPKMEDRFNYFNDSQTTGVEYFAVYDGHGGDSAANFIESNLYSAINKKILQMQSQKESVEHCEKPLANGNAVNVNENNVEGSGSGSARRCSEDLNRRGRYNRQLSVSSLSQIVTEEILEIDKQLMTEAKKNDDVAGSTALIAIRVAEYNKLIVANVGDSRGVICDSRGSAIPLSFDHKPQQLKEHRRIKEAGGFIKFNGVWRVAGILATSRALGDYPLKERNLIIAEPDILIFDLNDIQPQFLILASDGLWDTFSNEEAVMFVKEHLRDVKSKKYSASQLGFEIAKCLALESYHRGSLDNITVVVALFAPKNGVSVSS